LLKKNLHPRCASGSIFFRKALPVCPAFSGEGAYKKPPEASADGDFQNTASWTQQTEEAHHTAQAGRSDRLGYRTHFF
jgi:hypothetical protein